MIKIVGVGDIMPGGVLAGIDEGYVSQEVLGVLQSGDIRVGTLETAIGNIPAFSNEKMSRKCDVIYALDHDLIKLKDLGFDVVSLANNHFFDLGPDGGEHAVRLLDEMGIKHVGAGKNIEEASSPAVINIGGKSVAFVSFCETEEKLIGWCPVASSNSSGVNPLTKDNICKLIPRLKEEYDIVVVLPHWGKEGQIMPTDRQYRLSKIMIESGADLVLGSHTHCVQPVFQTKGKVIVFGMGNFLFPDRLIVPPRSTYYPETIIDFTSLPVTDRYPYVDKLTFKKWRAKARLGGMVECTIEDNSVNVREHVVCLSKDNHVGLIKEKYKYDSQLKLASAVLRSGCFIQLYKVYQMGNMVKRMLKKFKNILKL